MRPSCQPPQHPCLLSNSLLAGILLLLAAALRLLNLGTLPAGINCDEAYAAYEAFSLLNNGTDSWGYSFPVYLITGGGGTSALYTYLTILFMAFLSPEIWVIRLPQALLGIASCYVFYRLLLKQTNKPTALLGLFLITIMPWHIIASRWGFHGNTAPAFLLFAFYFYCRAFQNTSYLILSLVLYALSVYTYDPVWPFVALVLPFELLYFYYILRPTLTAQTYKKLLPALILPLLMVIPLALLLLINFNIIAEIRMPHFSIPKLPGWRASEAGFAHLATNAKTLLMLLLTQDDKMIWNTLPPFGLFYPISLPLIILGASNAYKSARIQTNARRFSFKAAVLLNLIAGLLAALTFSAASSNRVNFLFFPLTLLLCFGLSTLKPCKKTFAALIALYIAAFITFTITLFTRYNDLAADNFSQGFKQALAFADSKHQTENVPVNILSHQSEGSKILFYNKIPPKIFQETVLWQNYPSAYLKAISFAHYRFYSPTDNITIAPDNIYIAPTYLKNHFLSFRPQYPLAIKTFKHYIVIYNFLSS